MRTSDPRHLGGRRRGRGQGLRDRRVDPDRPLAGPANRQGRIAADVDRRAATRASAARRAPSVIGALRRHRRHAPAPARRLLSGWARRTSRRSTCIPNSHAGYYPGAKTLGLKVLFRKSDGRAPRGAGARPGRGREADRRHRHGDPDGRDGVRPRGGGAVLRAAVRQRQGPGQLRGDGRRPTCCAATCRSPTGTPSTGSFLLDVRNPPELAAEAVPGAVNIPLPAAPRPSRRAPPRPRDQRHLPLGGQRGYYATRILLQNGFKARDLSGGMLSRSMVGRGLSRWNADNHLRDLDGGRRSWTGCNGCLAGRGQPDDRKVKDVRKGRS